MLALGDAKTETEIERKFLVNHLGLDLANYRYKDIEQFYIPKSNTELRIRRANGEYSLVSKHRQDRAGLIRKEKHWHFPIIRKRRYYLNRQGLTLELDIYEPPLNPLKIVEVEFPTKSAAMRYEPLKWFGPADQTEVTYNRRYRNSSLLRDGLPIQDKRLFRIWRRNGWVPTDEKVLELFRESNGKK